MIVTKLIGGLGNQMFQYAAGKALADFHQTSLFLDLSAYKAEPNVAYTNRNYELGIFNLQALQASQSELDYFLKENNKLQRIIARYFPKTQKKMVLNEYGHLFYDEFFNCPKDTYLNGFWQCEKYFSSIRPSLLKDFTIKDVIPEKILEIQNKIKSSAAVSIHVRRGDYVNLKSASDFHGACSLNYYEKAHAFLKDKFENFNLFIFSDDIAWCKQNFSFQNMHFIEQQHGPHWDMFLMSFCNHNIIANSSFSWWGAWLNENENKSVVLPDFWFRNVKTESLGIKPDNWILIEEKDNLFD
ncbi:MAG: alpha-1,2-fucosyltransferase [Sphingobacteriaceae bacterium]|nr:alpha-1,2-fucosyltransferase [Sphingobacteriaceae bacterium]